MKKIVAASASIALAFGAFSGVMSPANAAVVQVQQGHSDGWTVRSQICSWFPYWCD